MVTELLELTGMGHIGASFLSWRLIMHIIENHKLAGGVSHPDQLKIDHEDGWTQRKAHP